MIRQLVFILFTLLSTYLGGQEEVTPAPSQEETSTYPQLDERFLEELKKQDQKQEVVGESRFYQEFLYMLVILGMIVGALILISWSVKKMMHSRIEQMNLTNLIKVLERRDLSQKSALYLIEINGKGTLIGESPQGMTHLANVDLEASESTFEQIMNNK